MVTRTAACLVAIALAATAWARVPDPIPPAVGDFPDTIRGGWLWREAGPRLVGDVADVAVLTGGAKSVIAIVDVDGGVWLSDDAEGTWRRVLAPSEEDDQPKDDPRDAIEDAIGGGLDIDGDLQDAPDPTTAEDQLQEEFSGVGRAQHDAEEPFRPHLWFTADGDLLCGRRDGLYGSDDLGMSWQILVDAPATALVLGPDGWLLGTDDGVLGSSDPLDWSSVTLALRGATVEDLAVDWTGVHAATDHGLYHSDDGVRWTRRSHVDSLKAIVLDAASDRLWVAGADGIGRSDDEGANVALLRNSPHGVRSLASLGGSHLLATGDTGTFETADGGATWLPVIAGLSDPTASAVVVVDGIAWLAADQGLYRLEPDDGSTGIAAVPDWVSLDALVWAALSRPGVRYESVGNRVVAGMLPLFYLDAKWVPTGALRYSQSVGSTSYAKAGTFVWGFRFVWTPGASRNGGLDPEVSADDLGDLTSGDVDLEDLGLDVEDVIGAAEARDKLGSDNRLGGERSLDIATDVRDLYHTRQTLVGERKSLASRPLRERVGLELDIIEVEARLDLLTDGAVSRLASTPKESP